MKIARKRATLFGFTSVAFLMLLLMAYAVLKGVEDIWPLIFMALPVFCIIGGAIGMGYFLFAKWQYEKARRS